MMTKPSRFMLVYDTVNMTDDEKSALFNEASKVALPERKLIMTGWLTDNQLGNCTWVSADDWDYYETECGYSHYLTMGDIADNAYKYCPYCGGFIQEV